MNTSSNTTIKSPENAGKIPSGALWAIFTIIIVAIVFAVIIAAKKGGSTNGDTPPSGNASTTPITATVNSKDWIKGNPAAKVTIVEYSDFQCPACASFEEVLEAAVYPKYLNDIRFVYRHYPLAQHANAIPAARAAEAAGAQGKFWEMHKLLFANQEKWSTLTAASAVTKVFLGYADSLKLDLEKFTVDMNASATNRAIDEDLRQGTTFGVAATPTFYLNDVKMQGFNSFQEFVDLIGKAVDESKNESKAGANASSTSPASL